MDTRAPDNANAFMSGRQTSRIHQMTLDMEAFARRKYAASDTHREPLMNYRKIAAAMTVVVLAGCQSAWHQKPGGEVGTTAHGDITVTVNHNDNTAATPAFTFEDVPAPSKTDAATTARFSLVDGETDPNSGGLDTLHDGRVPTAADQPSANFFFNAGTDGGRVLVDLGHAIEIKEINTYSWHPGTRGPQVYELYASDGAAGNFNSRPKRGTNPEQCGWQRMASVDTRPKDGDGGGQYGVSISATAGALGKYRYLLFDISDTEGEDDFGNTFYSEMNVIDAQAPAVAAEPVNPAASPALFVIPADHGRCKITIDTTAAPRLAGWADHKLAPVLARWYPRIVALLPSPGFTAPTHYTITVKHMDGVAYTTGTHVFVSEQWIQDQMNGEAIGSLVHESVHVVQQYGWGRRDHPNATRSPGWLVEGMADYIRWFKYEPQSHGADIVWMRQLRNFTPRYDDSYRVTANFLDWVTQKDDPKIVTQLNAAMREGRYTDDLWKQYTGRTVQELGREWQQQIESQLAAQPAAGNGSKQGT